MSLEAAHGRLTCPDCVWPREVRADFWAEAPDYVPPLLLPFTLVALVSLWLGRRFRSAPDQESE
ncbi:hypothetical protein WME97_33495 [Sorangium sp. So ce367]|uniref:hypothetical protein n=1 Tax=Sorangium sp. So ce367 TaxID=3133305 RepID=UPI003F615DE2